MWVLDDGNGEILVNKCKEDNLDLEEFLYKVIIKCLYFNSEEFTRKQLFEGVNHEILFSDRVTEETGLLGLSFVVYKDEIYNPVIYSNSDIYYYINPVVYKELYYFRFVILEKGLKNNLPITLSDIFEYHESELITIDSSEVLIDMLNNINNKINSVWIRDFANLLNNKPIDRKLNALSITCYKYLIDRFYESNFMESFLYPLLNYYENIYLIVDKKFIDDYIKAYDSIYFDFLFKNLRSCNIKIKLNDKLNFAQSFSLKILRYKTLDEFIVKN